MIKSRRFYIDDSISQNKILKLESIYLEYVKYLQICVKTLLDNKKAYVKRSEFKYFFVKSDTLLTNMELACRGHACDIVKMWASSSYQCRIKDEINTLRDNGIISSELADYLRIIGKCLISKPQNILDKFCITQDHIDLYWYLLNSKIKNPELKHVPIKLDKNNSILAKPRKTNHFNWWLSITSLNARERVHLPLKGNPHIEKRNELVNSFYLYKDKNNRWVVDICEKRDYPEPKPIPNLNIIGLDVGKICPAVLSNGQIFGTHVADIFNRKYSKIKEIRTERQKQKLLTNSKRLSKLEQNLTGFLKTELGKIANTISRTYSDCILIHEDLVLKNSPGDKRFPYNLVINLLNRKMPCIAVHKAYTSQCCPCCGFVSSDNRIIRNRTSFICRSCGVKYHADVVGAINIAERFRDDNIDINDSHTSVKQYLKQRYQKLRDRRGLLNESSSTIETSSLKTVCSKRVVSLQPKMILIRTPQRSCKIALNS